jgi:hypothetical protein
VVLRVSAAYLLEGGVPGHLTTSPPARTEPFEPAARRGEIARAYGADDGVGLSGAGLVLFCCVGADCRLVFFLVCVDPVGEPLVSLLPPVVLLPVVLLPDEPLWCTLPDEPLPVEPVDVPVLGAAPASLLIGRVFVPPMSVGSPWVGLPGAGVGFGTVPVGSLLGEPGAGVVVDGVPVPGVLGAAPVCARSAGAPAITSPLAIAILNNKALTMTFCPP